MKDRVINTNTPRWIIFIIDLLISIIAIFGAFSIRFNYELINFNLIVSILPYIFIVRLLGSFLGGTYSGIIRFTNAQDAFRIFRVLSLGSLFLCIINFLPFVKIPYSIIIIEYLLILFLMVSLRIMVKLIYHNYITSFSSSETIIIYGSDEFGLNAKAALDSSIDSKANIVAFIDPTGKKKGKKLEGVKVFSIDDIGALFECYDVDKLIIAKKDLDLGKKNDIVDFCLNANVKVCGVPDIDAWVNGELNAKQIKAIKIDDLLERKPIKLENDAIAKQLKGKVVMITGAAGSIGSEIVRQVSKFKPGKIILVDQAESPMYEVDLELRESLGFTNFELVMGDVRDKARLKLAFEKFKPNVVYHAAAYKHVPMMEENPSEAIKTNVLGTRNVADLALEFSADAFVMISTDKAVNPTNVMGASKRLAEIYVQALSTKSKHTQFITTRFGNVLGSNGSVIPRFKNQIENRGPITVTHPDITRYFMTIPEACQLVLQAAAVGEGGKIFIFDMGESVKIVDLAYKMIKLSGLELGVDIKVVFTGLRPGEKLYEELLNEKENTYPTEHSRIMIAKVRKYSYEKINTQYIAFNEILATDDNFQIVKYMKDIVPEFKSKNSIYEKLDTVKESIC